MVGQAVIAIDPGTRRTGFAVADPLRVACEPLATYTGDPGDDAFLEHLAAFLAERYVETFVIGLPRHMDGSEGERAAAVRALAVRVGERFPDVRVALQDERLSTKEAEELLRETGHRRWQDRRGKRDAMSALVILRDWIEAGEPLP
jgi:putative Holliday junction resolvase